MQTLEAGQLWRTSTNLFLVTTDTTTESKFHMVRLASGSDGIECVMCTGFAHDDAADIKEWLQKFQYEYVGNISVLTKAILCLDTPTS